MRGPAHLVGQKGPNRPKSPPKTAQKWQKMPFLEDFLRVLRNSRKPRKSKVALEGLLPEKKSAEEGGHRGEQKKRLG